MLTYSLNQNTITKNKNRIFLVLKVFIAAGLIYYLISSIEYNEIIKAIESANGLLIAIAFSLTFINICLQFLKWKLTCKTVLSESGNSKIFTSLLYGLSAGLITPGRIGEYFGRAIAFKNKPLVQVTAATLTDKFFPLMIVAFLGSMSSILFLFFYYRISVYLTLALFIILFTFFYFLFIVIRNEKFWDSVFFIKLKNSKRFSKLFLQLESMKKLDSKFFVQMSVLSFLFYICFLLQFALLVSAFSHNSEIISYLWAGNLIMFVKTIIPPITLGELGIREGASVFFLGKFGELSSVAFNASIFLFLINIVFPALIGLILLLKKND